MDGKLKDKVAIITGSSRGIGKAIALDFAREGAKVVIAARSEAQQEKLPGTIAATAGEIRAFGGTALPVKCNVADEQSVTVMTEKTLEEFGRVDILVNNAGIGYYVPLIEASARHFELVFRVNLMGAFLCIKAVLPVMIEQKSGSIVNITSYAADELYSLVVRDSGQRNPIGSVYGASKAALNRLTRGLAIEVAEHNIAANAVAPSAPTYSEGLAMWNPDADPALFRSAHQYMTRAAVFLASQDSRGVTGGIFFDEELCLQYNLA